jgi:hypothetical protein
MRSVTVLAVVFAGCISAAEPTAADKDPQGGVEEQQDPFKLNNANVKPVPFDGKRAMKYLKAICDIGPRQSGTKGMREQIELITKHFEDLGLKVEVQAFSGKQVSRKEAVEMKNLIIRFFPDKEKRVILCSHYDTRPIADQEDDPRKWKETFVSANDGGSGVAFLMELAHHLKGLKLDVGVDFVLFDGEEFIFDRNNDEYFFGSKHFAKEWRKNKGKVKYGAAVLLDMIGGDGAKFPIEVHSWQKAKEVCRQIWDTAAALKVDMFRGELGDRVLDDHIALQNAGIPAIDIIDFSYPHWHKLSDVPANCSGESLENVSKVLSVWLQRLQ